MKIIAFFLYLSICIISPLNAHADMTGIPKNIWTNGILFNFTMPTSLPALNQMGIYELNYCIDRELINNHMIDAVTIAFATNSPITVTGNPNSDCSTSPGAIYTNN